MLGRALDDLIEVRKKLSDVNTLFLPFFSLDLSFLLKNRKVKDTLSWIPLNPIHCSSYGRFFIFHVFNFYFSSSLRSFLPWLRFLSLSFLIEMDDGILPNKGGKLENIKDLSHKISQF